MLHDVIYLVAYPLLGLASLLMVRARTGGRDRDNVIETLPVEHALDGMSTERLWLLGGALGAAPLAHLRIAPGSAHAPASRAPACSSSSS